QEAPTRKPPSAPQRLPQGQRNSGLTRLAGVLRRWGLDEEEIREVLQSYNAKCCEPPLPDREVEKIARSVAKYEAGTLADTDDPARCTDLGNARLFAAQHADAVRYVTGLGWIIWTGTHWVVDADGGAMRLAKATADLLLDAAQVVADEARRKHLTR